MKRLFLTLGLVIAFLISVNNANAALGSIFDTASYQAPKSDQSIKYDIYISKYSKGGLFSDLQSGISHVESNYSRGVGYTLKFCEVVSDTAVKCTYKYCNQSGGCTNGSDVIGSITLRNSITTSCPPDDFPLYTVGVDNNNDGKDDQCYNPDELDNLSNCANEVGSMLPAITNLSNKVCKTDPNSGARCGYSKKDGDIVYKTDLEMNCFGDGEKVPEYNPEPMPEPDKCAKYNDQLMVCKADPKEKCDALGNCGDQCGFVNKELFCFIECEGADCDKETPPPPVNCETNPTAPVCVEEPEPDPEFCKANPTDPKCTVKPPEPCTGDDCPPDGGGGTGEKIDLKPVVDELKELNKKLDINTTNTDSTRKMGLLETAFDEDAISEIKSKTDEIKSEINGFYTSTKAEISSMFSFSTGGGSYEPITFAFTYGTYSSKIWEYFSQNVAYIAAAIMFLAYLMAARIVLE